MRLGFFSGFSNIKMRNKLILCFLTPIILAMGLMAYLIISGAEGFMKEQIDSNAMISADQLKENVKNKLTNFINISDAYYSDKYLQTILQDTTDDMKMLEFYQRYLIPNITRYSYNNDYSRICIYVDNEHLLKDGSFLADIDLIRDEEFFQRTLEANGKVVWSGVTVNKQTGKRVFYLTRLLNVSNSLEPVGIFLMEIPQESIYHLFNTETKGKDILILNSEGEIIASTDKSTVGMSARETKYKEFENLETGKFINTTFDNNVIKIINEHIDLPESLSGWKIITVIPMEVLLYNVNKLIRMSIFICLLISIITMLIIFIFSEGLAHRLKLLSNNILKVKRQNFEGIIDIGGRDEIGVLADDFNAMTAKINELINQVYKEKLLKMDILVKQRDAELKALQSQINPHFLYNTLDSIRMHALTDEKEKASAMLLAVSRILRYSISSGDEIVTLKDEITNVKEYVEIYRIRYGGAIKYIIDIPEEISENIVPKMIIQPIVENAFIHGFKNSKGSLLINIAAERTDDNNVRLYIKDDGCGIPPEKVNKLNDGFAGLKSSDMENLGLRNVNERIRLYFGPQYGLRIESELNNGTVVFITFPCIKEERNEETAHC